MADSSSFAYSKEAAKKNFISFYELLSIVLNYISPRGDKKLRLRLIGLIVALILSKICLLYTSPSPRDQRGSRMPSSA